MSASTTHDVAGADRKTAMKCQIGKCPGCETCKPATPKTHLFTDKGKRVELTEEMVRLRNGIAQGLGYELVPCSIGKLYPDKPHSGKMCWERGTYMEKMPDGTEVPIGNYHCVSGVGNKRMEATGERMWPEDVTKAAKALDREGVPPRKRKPWETQR